MNKHSRILLSRKEVIVALAAQGYRGIELRRNVREYELYQLELLRRIV